MTRVAPWTRAASASRRQHGIVALVAVLLVSGCTGSGEDERDSVDDAPDVAEVVDAVARERAVGDRLTPEGTIPLDLALDLFASGYGPIEGGTADDALRGDASGSGVLAALLRHQDELTPGQRAAFDAAVGGRPEHQGDDADADADDRNRAGHHASNQAGHQDARGPAVVSAAFMDSTTGPLPDLGGDIQAVRQELERRLGFRLLARIEYAAGERPSDPTWALAAIPMRDGRPVESGPMGYCHIEVYPPGRAFLGTPTFKAFLAHEVMHCLQFAMAEDVARVLSTPDWAREGSADFAAATVATLRDPATWGSWLEHPERPVTRRVYSGLGAFAAAQQAGVDVWSRIEPMLGLPHREALEILFGTSAERAMTTIAQSLVREPVLGAAWEATGPGVTDDRGTAGFGVSEGSDVSERVDLVPYATAPYAIELRGEVIDLEIEGAIGRIGLPGGGTSEIAASTSARFCVAGSCECPDGGHMGGTEIPDDGVLGIALTTTELTGPLDRTQRIRMRIAVPTVEEACRTRPAAEILVVRVTDPTPFEIHGGHCLLQDNGVILVQAGQDRYPPGYRLPPEHLDDASIDIVKDPPTPPHHGTVTLRLGGVEQPHDDQVHLDADLLGGTFRTGNGVAGEWRCADLVTPDELWGTGD